MAALHGQEPLTLYAAKHALILLGCNPSTATLTIILSTNAAIGLSLVVIISEQYHSPPLD